MSATTLDELRQQHGVESPKPGVKPQPEPENQQERQQEAPRSKETNFRALEQAKQEAERRAAELAEKLKEFEEKQPDPKWQTLQQRIELEYENDPEKLISDLLTKKEKETEWETRLKEKDEEVQKIAFHQSDAYKRNVEKPLNDAISSIEGLLDGDKDLMTGVTKLILDDKGQLPTTPLDSKQKAAIKAAIAETGSDVPLLELYKAINALKETEAKGRDYVANYKTRQQQEQERQQREQMEAMRRDQENAKLIRLRAKNAARQNFPDTLKEVAALVDDATMDDVFKEVQQELEDVIEGRSKHDFVKAYNTNAKAKLFDKLMENGTIAKMVKAMGSVSDLKREGDGTRPRHTAGQQTNGTSLDDLRRQHGVQSPLSR